MYFLIVCHCLAGLSSVFYLALTRSLKLLVRVLLFQPDPFSVMLDRSFTLFAVSQDRICSDAIHGYRLTYGQHSSFEEVIYVIACN